MKNILTQLIEKLACKHKWITYGEFKSTNMDLGYVFERTEILVCTKCGKITKITP